MSYTKKTCGPHPSVRFLKYVILIASIFISDSDFKHSFTEVLASCSPHPFQS